MHADLFNSATGSLTLYDEVLYAHLRWHRLASLW